MILALVPAIAFGEASFELVDLSDEDLALVNRTVQQELFKRAAVQGVTVPAGQYTVGVDLPAGTYRVVYEAPNSYTICLFWAAFDDIKDGDKFAMYQLDTENNLIGKLQLYDKQTVSIDHELVFYTYTGLFN